MDVPQHPQSAPICLLGSLSAVEVGREREREGERGRERERERERERKIQSMNLVMSFIKLLAGSVATVAPRVTYESSNTVPFVQGIGSFQTKL